MKTMLEKKIQESQFSVVSHPSNGTDGNDGGDNSTAAVTVIKRFKFKSTISEKVLELPHISSAFNALN